ncbi:transcriptional regulator YeiL [Alkalithermobacter paradoxus]|uniref:Regulatory protein YeiL n=1 Tax=Alkalithermobacter paradoxus TaxID=29349 RepID=A0A1V4I8D8_9FIRM|nr:regulatory protein YeiL [[Clostridium] thermoalcaliphilum]
MKKLRNYKLIESYISKYKINEIFTQDMSPFMELFLFRKNDYICKEGNETKYLFFFVDGKAKVYITLSNGKSLLLCFYENFKVLGDLELIDTKPASTNVQAIEDSYCIGISLDNVRKYLLDDSKFLRFICNSLSDKLNRCSNNSSINLLYPLENRLASYILATGKNMDNKIIVLNENLTEISELLGTSYRHLLRTLNILKEKRVIHKENDNFIVIDEVTLKKLAADLYK